MSPTLTATVWDRIRERMEKRSMTRFEYATLARYWRVRRRAMRYGAHHERQLRRAEEDLVRAVTMAFIAEKWAPTVKWLNAFRGLAPVARQLATAHAQAKEAGEE